MTVTELAILFTFALSLFGDVHIDGSNIEHGRFKRSRIDLIRRWTVASGARSPRLQVMTAISKRVNGGFEIPRAVLSFGRRAGTAVECMEHGKGIERWQEHLKRCKDLKKTEINL